VLKLACGQKTKTMLSRLFFLSFMVMAMLVLCEQQQQQQQQQQEQHLQHEQQQLEQPTTLPTPSWREMLNALWGGKQAQVQKQFQEFPSSWREFVDLSGQRVNNAKQSLAEMRAELSVWREKLNDQTLEYSTRLRQRIDEALSLRASKEAGSNFTVLHVADSLLTLPRLHKIMRAQDAIEAAGNRYVCVYWIPYSRPWPDVVQKDVKVLSDLLHEQNLLVVDEQQLAEASGSSSSSSSNSSQYMLVNERLAAEWLRSNQQRQQQVEGFDDYYWLLHVDVDWIGSLPLTLQYLSVLDADSHLLGTSCVLHEEERGGSRSRSSISIGGGAKVDGNDDGDSVISLITSPRRDRVRVVCAPEIKRLSRHLAEKILDEPSIVSDELGGVNVFNDEFSELLDFSANENNNNNENNKQGGLQDRGEALFARDFYPFTPPLQGKDELEEKKTGCNQDDKDSTCVSSSGRLDLDNAPTATTTSSSSSSSNTLFTTQQEYDESKIAFDAALEAGPGGYMFPQLPGKLYRKVA